NRNCNSGRLKAFIYIVFKVRLRDRSHHSPFQKMCQESKWLKPLLCKVRGRANQKNPSKPCIDVNLGIF
ncbi:hypothetical protein, partial [Anabaena sp. PCC 7938]|uniref:hypothetical protein n=1 Tax=Anabaena sp. PCC 7938 TaxID=1296340 RepID=UPI0020303C4A